MGHKLLLVLVAVGVSGCATAIPYGPHEQCAQQGETLEGVSTGRGVGYTPNFVTGRGLMTVSNTYSVNCREPQTEQEKCKIDAIQKEMVPKAEYNEHIENKKIVNETGYLLFLVPGVVAKVLYDDQRSDALAESNKIWEENKCDSPREPASK